MGKLSSTIKDWASILGIDSGEELRIYSTADWDNWADLPNITKKLELPGKKIIFIPPVKLTKDQTHTSQWQKRSKGRMPAWDK